MSAPPVGVKAVIKEVLRTRSGVAAFILLALIIGMAVITPFYAPYNVVKTWNDPKAWVLNPRSAAPEWVEFFYGKRMPRTIILERADFKKSYTTLTSQQVTIKKINLRASFNYQYDDFPSEFKIVLNASTSKSIRVDLSLTRPDGDKVALISTSLSSENPTLTLDSGGDEMKKAAEQYVLSVTGNRSSIILPQVVFFAQKGENIGSPSGAEVLKGRYRITAECVTTDVNGDVDIQFIAYGRVFGLAGTDSKRRDLLVGILWGAPVALAFGLIAAVAVTLIQMFFGVISGYFGGKTDVLIQRVAELMMIIPFLPILILVSFIYKTTIWTLLAIIVGLSLVGSTTKVIRSMVPQIKEEQYILAAISYGASSWRIIFRHIIPRVLPYTLSIIAMAVPSYIFLEAALSFLGLGDPVLPTWGKILGDAQAAGAAYHGYWWWVLIPAGCIGVTAAAFALLGYAFDRIVNPRLREM